MHFQSVAHHDDGNHQGGQADEVELLGEQSDEFAVAALTRDKERLDQDAAIN